MTVLGEKLDLEVDVPESVELVPQGSQVKKYQSIEPVRSTLDQRVQPLQKMQPGLHDINLGRVKPDLQSPITISPPTNNRFVFSPDLLLAQQHENLETYGGLISPNFFGSENRNNLRLESEDGDSSSKN